MTERMDRSLVRPEDDSGMLDRVVGIEELAANHSHIRLLSMLQHRLDPVGCDDRHIVIEEDEVRRVGRVLAIGALHRHAALVLGAWGCGVFRNDPTMVARLFKEALTGGGPFATAFEHVSFAVLDRGGETLAAFERQFA